VQLARRTGCKKRHVGAANCLGSADFIEIGEVNDVNRASHHIGDDRAVARAQGKAHEREEWRLLFPVSAEEVPSWAIIVVWAPTHASLKLRAFGPGANARRRSAGARQSLAAKRRVREGRPAGANS
jgi:hypothetical protein